MGMLLRCNKDGAAVEDYVSRISREITFLILDNIPRMCHIWMAFYVQTRIACTSIFELTTFFHIISLYYVLLFYNRSIRKICYRELYCLVKKSGNYFMKL